MGHALGKAAIAHGDLVTAVGWTAETTIEQFQQYWNGPQCLGLLCDVRVRETVDVAIRRSIERWGHIDIIVKYEDSPLIRPTDSLMLFSAAPDTVYALHAELYRFSR
jgi:hypothetical protein